MHFHIVKVYKDKEVKKNVKDVFFINVWRKNIFDIYVTEYGTALTTILPILFLYLNTVSDRRNWDVFTSDVNPLSVMKWSPVYYHNKEKLIFWR